MKAYDYRCPFCRERNQKLTVEHIVPKAMGGGFSKENVVPACAHCNNLRSRVFSISPHLLFALEFPLYSEDSESRILRMADPVRLTWLSV
ncbi:MAG: HNH endonuclease [Candidatus Thorarchaeota archaeon]